MLTYRGVPRRTRIMLRALVCVGVLGMLVAITVKLASTPGPHGYAGGFAWVALGVLPVFVVGVWLAGRRPDHVQARRLLLVGAAFGAATGVESLIQLAYRGPADDSWLWAASLTEQIFAMLSFTAICVLLATYPDGTVEQRWQRVVIGALWAPLALPPLLLLTNQNLVIHPIVLNPVPDVPSPFFVPWLAPLGPPLAALFLGYLAALAATAVLFVRFLQAGTEQRRRMRLLVYSLAFGITVLMAENVLRLARVPPESNWYLFLGSFYIPVLLMLPVSIVLGVLRYRLFDIDLVVRRSVVYGVLTLGIAAVYIGLAAAPGLALGSQVPVELAVVLTILAAVAFQPLRRRVERLADRWVFGAKVNRYQLLTAFGASLEQTVELRELLPRLADTVRRGLTASWVRVSLPGAGAVSGEPAGDAELTVALRRRGESVGQIECGPKPGGYEPGDRELLATLAGQAATAIANVALNAQLAERLDELDQSRARIVAAQDTERRRIERNIHDGAQQQVVALLTKLRLARNQLGRGERSSDEVLDELHADARELLVDLRELAHGIHPPVLSDRGLVAAVEARADRLPLNVSVQAQPALRERRLDSEVEGAAYFVVCEALTNVVKHAHATAAQVALAANNGHLEVTVSDDGVGLPATNGTGTGLVNLRDRVEALGGRLTVTDAAGGGARVHAELPAGRETADRAT